MNKIVNATDPKSMLKELAIEFITPGGKAKFNYVDKLAFEGGVDVFGDIKYGNVKHIKPSQCDEYCISTTAEVPTKFKSYKGITAWGRCRAIKAGLVVFDCRIEDLGLTKKQFASFVEWIKIWSLDYR